jgi:ArsR family transcriptional regulator
MSHHRVLTSVVTDELLRALADPTRGRIVELLAAEELCVCHLAEATGATSSNLSNHLAVLRRVGVVEAEPAGRFTYYRLRPEVLAAVSAHYRDLAERAGRATKVRRPCS